jgi:hypothetical protein
MLTDTMFTSFRTVHVRHSAMQGIGRGVRMRR